MFSMSAIGCQQYHGKENQECQSRDSVVRKRNKA